MANYVADAKALEAAMKGWGTDEQKLIQVICNKTHEQLTGIRAAYFAEFKKDLMAEIKSELSGNMEDFMVAMITPPIDLDAQALDDAMRGLGTNEALLSEILATRTGPELREIAVRYFQKTTKHLLAEVKDETSNNYGRACLHLLDDKSNPRVQSTAAIVAQDVKRLQSMINGEPRQGEDNDWLVHCLAGHSRDHGPALSEAFLKATGQNLHEFIRDKCHGDTEKLLVSLTKPVQTLEAELIIAAFNATGVDDAALCRRLCSIKDRTPNALREVAAEVNRIGHKTLLQFVQDRTSGDYKKGLSMMVSNFAN